jgi:hypothetical protein
MKSREWIVTIENGWLHVGYAVRGHINHGPQNDTEFETQKVLSFANTAKDKLLEALGTKSEIDTNELLEKLKLSELGEIDSLLLQHADAGLIGNESQTSEYMGSGMIEDHYTDYSCIVRFDKAEMSFRTTTQTNDWEPSKSDYEIETKQQDQLLEIYGKSSRKSFFEAFNISDFRAWNELHKHVRELSKQ